MLRKGWRQGTAAGESQPPPKRPELVIVDLEAASSSVGQGSGTVVQAANESESEFAGYDYVGKSFGQIAAETNLAFARAWRRKRAVEAPVATGAESAKKLKVGTDEIAQGARDGEDQSVQVAIEEGAAPNGPNCKFERRLVYGSLQPPRHG